MGKENKKKCDLEKLRERFDHPKDYLYSLKRIGVKLGLDKIKDFLSKLDDPQNDFDTIIVGGTNGKGSVCRNTVNILREAGYSTGLYISPHLIDFEERIQVNDEHISKDELWDLIEKIEPILTQIEKNNPEERPSFFEVLTAIAFLHFSKKDVDFAVLEVGMGGRLDATNVSPHDFSVITYVGFDHAEHLGESKNERAYEKAGIISEQNYFITGEKDETTREYFKKVCEEKEAEFNFAFDREYEILYDPLRVRTADYGEIQVNGLTSWQAENSLISLTLAETLDREGYELTKGDIIKGIEKTELPGKMEFIKKDPRIMIDSAHNKTGFQALEQGLKNLDYDRLFLIAGLLEDKDYKSMVEILGPIADKVYTAEPVSERKLDSAFLAEKFEKYCISESFGHGIEALERAQKEWKEGDLILITGSMYLLGDIIKKLR